MCTINRPLLRLASDIHDDLVRSQSNYRSLSLPIDAWERCADLARRTRRAELRGWLLAAGILRQDLRYALNEVQTALTLTLEQLPSPHSVRLPTTPRQIYADLVELEVEFGGLDFDLRERRISVTTEPIELEGVYLGPFAIQLHWGGQGSARRHSYRIIAQDPHPADSRQDVTHPHVADEVLCEGEGKYAIRQALEQARLLDFFTLVAGVLRTYNAESPFVELALWRGVSCDDCGAVVDEGDAYRCQACEDTICGGCESCCARCEESHCASCIRSCPDCEEVACQSCLKPCGDCGRRVCTNCLAQR